MDAASLRKQPQGTGNQAQHSRDIVTGAQLDSVLDRQQRNGAVGPHLGEKTIPLFPEVPDATSSLTPWAGSIWRFLCC